MCVWWSRISYGLWAAQARSRFPAESSMGSPAPSKHLSQKRKGGRFREITCSINLPQKAEF